MKRSTKPTPIVGFEPLEPRVHLSADFNGDGRDDIVLHNENESPSRGANRVGYMNGGSRVLASEPLQSVRDTDWFVAEAGDFDGDGKGDLLWRNRFTGANGIWLMDGTARVGSAWIPQLLDPAWHVRGVGDIDDDGDADILWHNLHTGDLAYWQMDGVQRVGVFALPRHADPNYKPAGVGDADGDGDGDIFWTWGRDDFVRATVWIMEGGARVASESYSVSANLETAYVPGAVRDFDGDGIAEVVLNYHDRKVCLKLGSTPPQATLSGLSFGGRGWWMRSTVPLIAGDLTGDGVVDLFWHRDTGENEVWSFHLHPGRMSRVPIANGANPNPGGQWFVAGMSTWMSNLTWDRTDSTVYWRNSVTGAYRYWRMWGTSVRGTAGDWRGLSPAWEVQAIGDYTSDPHPGDFLVYDAATGRVAAWTATREFPKLIQLGSLPAGQFHLQAVADIDGAGTPDLIWRDDQADRTVVWLMNFLTHAGTVELTSPGAGWVLHAATDFDRDGWHDLLWRNGGETRLWRMNATNLVESITLPAFDASNVLIGARDLDGDRNVEIVFHNSVSGVVTVWRMRGVSRHSLFEAGVQPPSWRVYFPRPLSYNPYAF